VNDEPSWRPDPTGRHQHRWFDGSAFTDRVADDGTTSIDPGPPATAAAPPSLLSPTEPTTSGWAPPTPVGPTWGPAWPGAQPAAPEPAAAPPHRSRLPLALALIGTVLVLAGGLAVVLTRDGGGGTGTFDGTIDDGSQLGTHEVSLGAGDVLLVTLRPGDDLDAVLGVLVDGDAADALEGTYDDDLAILERQPAGEGLGVDVDDAGDRDQLLLRTDVGFSGEPEELLLAVADDVDVTVAVAPFDPSADEDDYEITIEVVALDVDEGADAEELLEAVEDDDAVPSSFQSLAEEILGG
jgi:hypothetical protein